MVGTYLPDQEDTWLSVWGQVAVTSHAWGLPAYQAKPRYSRPSVELVAYDGRPVDGQEGAPGHIIIGFIDVEIESAPGELGLLKDSRCGFVWELGVLSGYRRLGVGRALVDEAAVRLSQQGIRRMEFWSMDGQAQAFYERLGAREVDRHYRFWLRPSEGSDASVRLGLKPGVKVQLIHATATEEDWPGVQGRVVREPPLEPHLCRGFDLRFCGW